MSARQLIRWLAALGAFVSLALLAYVLGETKTEYAERHEAYAHSLRSYEEATEEISSILLVSDPKEVATLAAKFTHIESLRREVAAVPEFVGPDATRRIQSLTDLQRLKIIAQHDISVALSKVSDAAHAEALLQILGEQQATQPADAIHEVYEQDFVAGMKRAMARQRYVLFFAMALVSVLLAVLFLLDHSRTKLNDLNREQEQRIEERTHDLADANVRLKAAHDEVLQASIAKSQFLANMSHELRTPLNSVIGFTNVLLKNKRGALNSQELTYLTRIGENGRHLLSLINDVLDLSKIEAGKIEILEERVRLDQLINETLQQFANAKPGVQLHSITPRAADIRSDGARLKQVLINLVGNALKFTETGNVTVELQVDATGRALAIEVSDTGIGIPADRLQLIFEAFKQADASTSRRYGGTGLGLAISASLADLLGCRIQVESQLGYGSKFRILLPQNVSLADDNENETEHDAAVGTTATEHWLPTGRELILVIDDDADARVLMTQMLEDAGLEVITANSGAQGLRMAHEFRPRAILLDLMMPGMSGIDVLYEIKNDAELRHIPVIVISIVAHEYSGSLIGAMDIIAKPFERDNLLTAIHNNLRREVKRVLVVDDDRDTRRLISSYLSDEDVIVETAVNGIEALGAIERFAPDVVIVDLVMPGMGGAECIEAIRNDDRFGALPVIVVTAKDLSHAELEKLRKAAGAVIRKGERLEQDLKAIMRGYLATSESVSKARVVA